VLYQDARRIMAQMYAFDRTSDYEGTLVPALEQFSALSGISDEQITAACPGILFGEIVAAIQSFFFRPRQTAENGGGASKKPESAPGA
jgi:hypothetical protein